MAYDHKPHKAEREGEKEMNRSVESMKVSECASRNVRYGWKMKLYSQTVWSCPEFVFKFAATTQASRTLSEMNRGAGNESKSQRESAGPLLCRTKMLIQGET